MIIQDHQFQAFCRAVDREDLARDERFAAIGNRFANYSELSELIAEELRRHSTGDFVERARRFGAPFGPVNGVDDFIADPHVAHRGTVVERTDERFSEATRYLAPAYRFERTPASIRRHAPRLGEHTDEILAEAGFPAEEIARLRESSVVR